PALAQGAPPATAQTAPAAAPPQAPAAQPAANEVEALVVTAEKREQSLQDVPVAVSAYTSAKREVEGITGIQDFVNFTPGMNYSGTDRVSLRGAGRNTFYIGNDPGVAEYTDGFYSASSAELFKSPLFVERTEILRGPQGTLYGRNAMGGAINIISVRPAKEFSGEIRAHYGNYDDRDIEGVVSIPLTEHLRLKLGGSKEKADGFIKNIGSGNTGGSINRTYFEGQLEGELGDKTTFWLRYSRTSWDDTTGVGDRWSNLVTPYDTALPFGPIGQLVTNPQYGYTVANPGVANPYVQNTNRPGYGQLRGNHLITVHITRDLGFADLKYIGGYQQYNYQTGGDYDSTSRTAPITVAGVPGIFVDYTTDFNEHKKYFSNEFDLASKENGGPLQWILGLYQYHENYAQQIQLADPQQAQLANPMYFRGINPATGMPILAPAAPNPSRDYVDQYATLVSDAWAVFGQATYKLNDQWSVTGGLRYTHDRKAGYETQRLILFSPAGPFGPALGGAYAFDVSTDLDNNPANGVQNARSITDDWGALTGTLNLNWQPDRDTLAYVKYSRGYMSGGFLLGTLSPRPEADQEGVNAYEVGLKKTVAHTLQVNAAAFYNDYQNLQLNVQQLNAAMTATANDFVNVGARAYGLELEAIWQPIRNLQFNASYGYLNTKITSGCCFYDPADPSALLPGSRPAGQAVTLNGVKIQPQNIEGSPLYQSPKNKFAINGNYTFNFEPGDLILSATYTWTDKTIYQPFGNDPAFAVPAYGTTDFRAIWNDAAKKYSVIAYVKNAFNKTGFTSTGSTNPTATFGLGASGLYQDGVAITRGLIEPRTYGVELQYRF
ncbi:MAG: TonB-dependent receptor, partial [Alphaproteobacteria bacterium]|nr:TonB-dependent receptor [Alphaproteobacteria bacterium]